MHFQSFSHFEKVFVPVKRSYVAHKTWPAHLQHLAFHAAASELPNTTINKHSSMRFSSNPPQVSRTLSQVFEIEKLVKMTAPPFAQTSITQPRLRLIRRLSAAAASISKPKPQQICSQQIATSSPAIPIQSMDWEHCDEKKPEDTYTQITLSTMASRTDQLHQQVHNVSKMSRIEFKKSKAFKWSKLPFFLNQL